MKVISKAVDVFVLVLLAGCAAGPASEPAAKGAADAGDAASSASSYACEAKQAAGTASVGIGAVGCHFRLHHTKTRRVLADTPYRLTMYAGPANGKPEPDAVLVFDGITDSQGRSLFLRSMTPIDTDRVKFVERIGSGPYGTAPRLLRPTDGLPVAGAGYVVEWCDGKHEGITDERGNGAAFQTDAPCKFKATFYQLDQ